MISSHLAGKQPHILLALLASTGILLTGCSSTINSAGTLAANPRAAKVGGKIHGGNQPVSGATVNLYFAGQNGFASGAKLVAHTTSLNDGAGSFSFVKSATTVPNDNSSNTFSCPTGPAIPYVFLVARGGNTLNDGTSSNNTDAAFIAPLAACDTISASTQVDMSEVVTVATIAAIHQYMSPTGSLTTPIESTIGSDGIFVSSTALANSFESVRNLVDLSTGLANTSLTRTGANNGAQNVVVTITPETAKINQLANAISACINNATGGSANCTALYDAAAPPPQPAATSVPGANFSEIADLLTAAYYIFTNPSNSSDANRQTIYNLSPSSGAPYQPTLSALPTDWSIGVKFVTTASAGTPNTCAGTATNFVQSPSALSIDLSGNLWVTGGAAGGGSLSSFSPVGTPSACFPIPSNSGAGTAVDVDGNIWSGVAGGNHIYRYTPVTSTNATASSVDVATVAPVAAITSDGFGDIYFATTAGDLYQIINGSTVATTAFTPVQINTITLGTPTQIMIDTQNRIFASSGSTFLTATAGTVTGPPSNQYLSGFTTTSYTSGSSDTAAIASTSSNVAGVYTSSVTDRSVSYLTFSGTTATVAPGFPATSTDVGAINVPTSVALDGAQNVWVANRDSPALSAFEKTGAPLTPTTGFQKDSSYFNGQTSIVIDSSGNIWLAVVGTNTITEVVGGAVPVYQPYALGLQPITNRFQTLP